MRPPQQMKAAVSALPMIVFFNRVSHLPFLENLEGPCDTPLGLHRHSPSDSVARVYPQVDCGSRVRACRLLLQLHVQPAGAPPVSPKGWLVDVVG